MNPCEHQWRHLLFGKAESAGKPFAELTLADFEMDCDRRRCEKCNRHDIMVEGEWVETETVTLL